MTKGGDIDGEDIPSESAAIDSTVMTDASWFPAVVISIAFDTTTIIALCSGVTWCLDTIVKLRQNDQIDNPTIAKRINSFNGQVQQAIDTGNSLKYTLLPLLDSNKYKIYVSPEVLEEASTIIYTSGGPVEQEVFTKITPLLHTYPQLVQKPTTPVQLPAIKCPQAPPLNLVRPCYRENSPRPFPPNKRPRQQDPSLSDLIKRKQKLREERRAIRVKEKIAFRDFICDNFASLVKTTQNVPEKKLRTFGTAFKHRHPIYTSQTKIVKWCQCLGIDLIDLGLVVVHEPRSLFHL